MVINRGRAFSELSNKVSEGPWTVACQAPLSMGFSSENTGVGCRFLLQGIFLTQESSPRLLLGRQILHHLSHQGSPEGHKTNIK